jgi:hypothetical protein
MKPTDPPPPKAPTRQAAPPATHAAAPGHHHYSTEELHNIDVAHEATDVNLRAVLGFAGIIAVVTVVCAVIVWVFFDVLESQAAARDPKLSPLTIPATQMPRSTAGSPFFSSAQQPQLVTDEPALLRMLRQSEDRALHEYGWVDQKTGVAHVPIDQAKKLLVERGLPSRTGGIDPALGTHAPAFGESTGGRSIPTGERSAAAPQAPQETSAPPPSGRGGGA